MRPIGSILGLFWVYFGCDADALSGLSGEGGTNWLLVEGEPQTGYDKIVTAN